MAKREVHCSLLQRLAFLCVVPTEYSTRTFTLRLRAKIGQQNTYQIHILYHSQVQRTKKHCRAKIQKTCVFNRNQTRRKPV